MPTQHDDVLSRLVRGLDERRGLFAAFVGVADAQVAETLGRAGFDLAILDMQHGAFDPITAAQAIAVLALGLTPAVVRIPVGEYQTASRLLDMGAAGIMAPMINTREDAERLVAYTKYPPGGERSWGPRRVLDLAGLDSASYFGRANALHRIWVMIETRAALDNLDAILAVDGIDGVYVGPSDLSVALTGGAGVNPTHPEVEAVLDRIAAAAHAVGKHAGLFTFSGRKAREMIARAFSFASIATDMLLLRAATESELADARGRES